MYILKNELLETARALYAQDGPGLSLSEVASSAGVSRATVYKKLGNKAQLLARLTAGDDETITHQDTEGRIMRAVMEAVTSRGFSAATIDQIAQIAGVGPATIYRLFGDKDTLIRAFMANQKSNHQMPCFPDSDAGDFPDQILDLTDQFLRFMTTNSALVRMVFFGNEQDREYLQGLRAQSESTFSEVATFFARHQILGNLADEVSPDDLAMNYVGMLLSHAILRPSGRPLDLPRAKQAIVSQFSSVQQSN